MLYEISKEVNEYTNAEELGDSSKVNSTPYPNSDDSGVNINATTQTQETESLNLGSESTGTYNGSQNGSTGNTANGTTIGQTNTGSTPTTSSSSSSSASTTGTSTPSQGTTSMNTSATGSPQTSQTGGTSTSNPTGGIGATTSSSTIGQTPTGDNTGLQSGVHVGSKSFQDSELGRALQNCSTDYVVGEGYSFTLESEILYVNAEASEILQYLNPNQTAYIIYEYNSDGTASYAETTISQLRDFGLTDEDILKLLKQEISFSDLFKEIEEDPNRDRARLLIEASVMTELKTDPEYAGLGITGTKFEDLNIPIEQLAEEIAVIDKGLVITEEMAAKVLIDYLRYYEEDLDETAEYLIVGFKKTNEDGSVEYVIADYTDPTFMGCHYMVEEYEPIYYSEYMDGEIYSQIKEMLPETEYSYWFFGKHHYTLKQWTSTEEQEEFYNSLLETIGTEPTFEERLAERNRLNEERNTLLEIQSSLVFQIDYYMENIDAYINDPAFTEETYTYNQEYVSSQVSEMTGEYYHDSIYVSEKADSVALIVALINQDPIYQGLISRCLDTEYGISSLYVGDDLLNDYLSYYSLNDETLKEHPILTEQEIQIINYLVNTGQIDEAYNYLERIIDVVDTRWYNAKRLEDQQWAEEHPVLASVLSIIITPFEGIASMFTSLNHLITGEELRRVDIYSTGAVYRESVSAMIHENNEFLGFLYDTGMSMADTGCMIAVSVLTGGTGFVFNTLLSVGMMGSRVYVSSLNDALDRGLDTNTAILYAFGTATVESVMESLSLGHLMGLEKSLGTIGDNFVRQISERYGKQWITKGAYIVTAAVSQGLCEGEEELCTEIVNFFFDNIVCQEKSHFNISINNYMTGNYLLENGEYGKALSENEAWIKALGDQATNCAWAFAGGFLSGFLFGGVKGGKVTYYTTQMTKSLLPLEVFNGTPGAAIDSGAINPVAEVEGIIKDINGQSTSSMYKIDRNNPLTQEQIDAFKLARSEILKNSTPTIIKAIEKMLEMGYSMKTINSFITSELNTDVFAYWTISKDILAEKLHISPEEAFKNVINYQQEYIEIGIELLKIKLAACIETADFIKLYATGGYYEFDDVNEPTKIADRMLQLKIDSNNGVNPNATVPVKQIMVDGQDVSAYFPRFEFYSTNAAVIEYTISLCPEIGEFLINNNFSTASEEVQLKAIYEYIRDNKPTIKVTTMQDARYGSQNFATFSSFGLSHRDIAHGGMFTIPITERETLIGKPKNKNICTLDKDGNLIISNMQEYGEKVLGGVAFSQGETYSIEIELPINNQLVSCPSLVNEKSYLAYNISGGFLPSNIRECVIKGIKLEDSDELIFTDNGIEQRISFNETFEIDEHGNYILDKNNNRISKIGNGLNGDIELIKTITNPDGTDGQIKINVKRVKDIATQINENPKLFSEIEQYGEGFIVNVVKKLGREALNAIMNDMTPEKRVNMAPIIAQALTDTPEMQRLYNAGMKAASDKYNVFFKYFREHAQAHTALVAEYAIKVAAKMDGIDYYEMIKSAIGHDFGMIGGYAYIKDSSGKKVFKSVENLTEEDVLNNTDEGKTPDTLESFKANYVRKNHPLNSALTILREMKSSNEFDTSVIALLAMTHSKSTSGIQSFATLNQWIECVKKLQAAVDVENSNTSPGQEKIDFKSYELIKRLESDETFFKRLQLEALAIRDGDAMSPVAVDKNNHTIMQAGGYTEVTVNDGRGTDFNKPVVTSEAEELLITDITHTKDGGEFICDNGFSKRTHTGELNVEFDSQFENDRYSVRVSLKDANSAPNSTWLSITERIGEVVTYDNISAREFIIELPLEAKGKALGEWYESSLESLKKAKISEADELKAKKILTDEQYQAILKFYEIGGLELRIEYKEDQLTKIPTPILSQTPQSIPQFISSNPTIQNQIPTWNNYTYKWDQSLNVETRLGQGTISVPLSIINSLITSDEMLNYFTNFQYYPNIFGPSLTKQDYINALKYYLYSVGYNRFDINTQNRITSILSQSVELRTFTQMLTTPIVVEHQGQQFIYSSEYFDYYLLNGNGYNALLSHLSQTSDVDNFIILHSFNELSQRLQSANIPLGMDVITRLNYLNGLYLKIINKSSEVLHQYSLFGTDQTSVFSLALNPSRNIALYNQLERTVLSYFPDMKRSEALLFLKGIGVHGICSYATLVNELCVLYDGQEEKFKKDFGYELYRIENGQKVINGELIMTDLYCFLNKNNPNVVVKITNGNNTTSGYIINDDTHQVAVSTLDGKDNYQLSQWLASKNIPMTWEAKTIYIDNIGNTQPLAVYNVRKQIASALADNHTLELDVFVKNKGQFEFAFYPVINSGTQNKRIGSIQKSNTWNEGAGHSIMITGLTNTGDLVVSSWGCEYILKWSEIANVRFGIFESWLSENNA
ncbi:MAG: hypothetical protein ACI4XM_03900 [Candidatus Coprovivens sp.]